MKSPLGTTIAGESVELWPQRALFWPAGGTMFIADPHFGKAAAFRSFGLAAPDGTAEDLQRLDELLNSAAATRLVVLGDFFHARAGRSEATLTALATWRADWPQLAITLVRGNHDRHAGDPPASLAIECVSEAWPLGPWACCHRPASHPDGHVLAGHVHPGVALRDRGGARLRSACFVSGPRRTLLPAFGAFTGLEMITPGEGERIFVTGESEVVGLPAARGRRRI